MGMLQIIYHSNGDTVATDVTYALAGVNANGEVVNEDKFVEFWRRVRIAQEKRDKEIEDELRRYSKG